MQSALKQPDLTEKSQHLPPIEIIELTPRSHGKLCGFLCGGLKTDGKAWLESLLGTVDSDEPSLSSQRYSLIELYYHILQQLIEQRFKLHPMFTDINETLENRAEALSHWCFGFLSGLQHAEIDISKSSVEDVQEIFYRFSDISAIDFDDVDIRAEDEKAFLDVLHYIQSSVITIYQEIAKSETSVLLH